MKKPEIIFLNVRDNQSKLGCIVSTVAKHYAKKQKILISVANESVAKYVDDLLWKIPTDAIIPHTIATHQTTQHIVITHISSNINHAEILINLMPNIHPLFLQFSTVYDLFDETTNEKMQLSEMKKKSYQEMLLTA